MSDAAYDIGSVLASIESTGILFVGTPELEILKAKVEDIILIDVVLFPYEDTPEGAVASGGPRRYKFRGRLISSLYNEKETKGRFVFEDGTVIYYDKGILD